MKDIEKILIEHRLQEQYIWVLDNKHVDIEEVSADKLKESISIRARKEADPDGPQWAGSGNFSTKKEAYACCAIAFGVLRLTTRNEYDLFVSVAQMAEEIEALDVQSVIDGKEIETLSEEITELKKRIERIENGKD